MADSDSILTLTGQIIHPDSSEASIEPNSRLFVHLQDISELHDVPTTIAMFVAHADVFPIAFNISYSSDEVTPGHTYALNAKIVNGDNELSLASNRRVDVKLLGLGRTTFIDIAMVSLKRTYHRRTCPMSCYSRNLRE